MTIDQNRTSSVFIWLLGFAVVGLLVFGMSVPAQAQDAWSDLKLHFDKPAAEWNHALPVGNGRLGAMVFGGLAKDRIQFNEETLWSGGPYDPVVENAHEGLPEIQRLMFEGEFAKAHDLFGRTMMGKPYEMMKYQPMGNLWLDFAGHDKATDYRRELDLDRAMATTSYLVNGVWFKREVFVSAVDQTIVIHISADKPGQVTFSADMHGVRNPAHSNYGTDYFQMDGISPNQLRITGKSSDYLGIEGKLKYEARLVATSKGGTVNVDYRTLRVEGADSATLVLAAATNFVNYKDVSGDESARVAAVLDAVSNKSTQNLMEDHLAEHRGWFRRVALNLEAKDDLSNWSLDKRIERFKTEPDPSLAALYYQFGRYLLISSSRPGTQPANLQGIWNDNPNPSWDSKYTININLPMNYWSAETSNLSEMMQPLEAFMFDIAEAGARTAKEHWNARGWVLHQNTDIWRATTPMDGPSWGAWPIGGAWLMTNLYEHYRFTEDKAYLERLYPILKGQAQFLLDILVEHPENDWLVTNPSNSPENFPVWPGNGQFFDEVSGLFLKGRNIAVGPTMDMQVIREVFAIFAEAATELGFDSALVGEVMEARKRLAPNQIGKHGQLQEWLEDFDELEPEHRHLSHLWGLYPGSEITPERAPDFAAASAKTIRKRGTGGCGFSYSWKMGSWARLYSGADAFHEFRAHLTASSLPNMLSLCGRAPQVDGTLGATAAMVEMLMQSHQGFIDLLPALPAEWATGQINGVRARGKLELDFAWKDGKLTDATLKSFKNGGVSVRARGLTGVRDQDGIVSFTVIGADQIRFDAVTGSTYTLEF
ncbi:MAG: glycoside hydrolase family 95 protein [Bacteroidetes bacterium]|nr:glycoside hydrolase family 95 protein [Bacteroidota bacterium]